MDMETVLPIKTVNDIIKEVNEANECNCKCKDEPIEEES
jgi:hypothetical protein